MRLVALIDWFVPPSMRDSEQQSWRARLLVVTLLCDLTISLVGQVALYVARTLPQGAFSRGHFVLAMVSALMVLLLLMLRRSRSLQTIGTLFVAMLYLTILAGFSLSVTPQPALPAVLLIIPPLMFLSLGSWHGIFWTSLTAITHMILLAVPMLETESSLADVLMNMVFVAFTYTVTGATCFIYDRITARHQQMLVADRVRLDYQAHHDPLTGLANRAAFQRELRDAIGRVANGRDRFALMIIDLNRFKPINDRYGHAAGDDVLKAIAERLSQAVRGSDFCARIGGDEFAVILRGLRNVEDADVAAAKIYAALCQPIALAAGQVDAGASIGMAVCPDDSRDADQLSRQADTAMYRAKAGGGMVCRYGPDDAKAGQAWG